MEHQVFVPVPADRLRTVLRDPVRVARCVPGLQQDADTASGPVSGRLKVRVGGSTVTYRGALTVTERDPGRFDLDGEGAEVRGGGTVTLSLVLRLLPREDGTQLDFTAGGAAGGRAAAFTAEATANAVRRLLDRAAELLAGAADGDTGTEPEPEPESESESDGIADPVAEAEEAEAETGEAADGDEAADVTEVSASVFDTEVPPPSLDPFLAGGFDELDGSPRPRPRPRTPAAR